MKYLTAKEFESVPVGTLFIMHEIDRELPPYVYATSEYAGRVFKGISIKTRSIDIKGNEIAFGFKPLLVSDISELNERQFEVVCDSDTYIFATLERDDIVIALNNLREALGNPQFTVTPKEEVISEIWLFWLDGKKEKAAGRTCAEAFVNAGYGLGAVIALDFFGYSDTHDWVDGKWVTK